MIKRYNVKAGADYAIPELEVCVDTVYKRYNIHTYEDSDGNAGYEYDEDEMTLVEYFRDSLPENQTLTNEALGELSILFGLYQQEVDETLAELSILLQGAINDV